MSRFAVLEASVATRGAGIVEMSRGLRIGPSRLVSMISKLQDEGLLEVSQVRNGKAGRPRIEVQVTSLGKEVLEAYGSLVTKPLKSRRSDLRRAAADADYASRLSRRGVSSFVVFLELNSIAMGTRRFVA